jgi:hypothetical protein
LWKFPGLAIDGRLLRQVSKDDYRRRNREAEGALNPHIPMGASPMATKQPGSPKDDERDIQRRDVGGDGDDEGRSKVKTPSESGGHPPGMGEDEDKDYVPEKR